VYFQYVGFRAIWSTEYEKRRECESQQCPRRLCANLWLNSQYFTSGKLAQQHNAVVCKLVYFPWLYCRPLLAINYGCCANLPEVKYWLLSHKFAHKRRHVGILPELSFWRLLICYVITLENIQKGCELSLYWNNCWKGTMDCCWFWLWITLISVWLFTTECFCDCEEVRL